MHRAEKGRALEVTRPAFWFRQNSGSTTQQPVGLVRLLAPKSPVVSFTKKIYFSDRAQMANGPSCRALKSVIWFSSPSW